LLPSPPSPPPAILFRTEDGGGHWKALTLPGDPGPGAPLSFVDPRDGWLLADVAGAGQSAATIFRTKDGGDHWSPVAHVDYGVSAANGLSSAGDKESLQFASTTAGWLTAFSGTGAPLIWRTNDGGASWEQQSLSAPSGVYLAGDASLYTPEIFAGDVALLAMDVSLQPEPNGQPYVVPSEGYPSALFVYTSRDGGRHWTGITRLPPIGSDQYPLVWKLLDPDHWWVGTNRQDWRTSDAGRTWKRIEIPATLSSLDFASPEIGWAVVASAPSQPGSFARGSALLLSVDGGTHWSQVSPASGP
jgi:photosystem II stability/assembly factor-like uncharacterized protein